jgi:translation initiation factor IF-2
LTDQERDARVHALTDAKQREDEDRRTAEENARRRAEREARDQKDREAAESRKRDEDERRRQEDERKRRAEDEARRRLGEVVPSSQAGPRPTDARRPQNLDMIGRRPAPSAPAGKDTQRPAASAAGAAARPAGAAAPGRGAAAADEESDRKVVIRRPGMPLKIITPPKAPKGPGGANRDRRGRLTISTATSGEDERTRSVASFRRRMQRMSGHRQVEEKEKLSREVIVPETITIQDLANRMAERAVDVIKL